MVNKIACLLNNNSVSLWDYPRLDFELNIKLKEVSNHQIELFFSEVKGKFITLERPGVINVWDVENSRLVERISIEPAFKYSSKIFLKSTKLKGKKFSVGVDETIQIFKELPSLKVWAVVTNKQTLLVYDIIRKTVTLEKKIASLAISKILFIEKHKALVLICHNTRIPVFLLKGKGDSLELTYLNYLVGHLGFVVDADLLREKSILVSIDELRVLKFWNLKTMTCVKTVSLAGKSAVRSFFCLESVNRLAIISRKINIYPFEHNIGESEDLQNDGIVSVFFAVEENLVRVFKKSEMLAVNHKTGKLEAVYKYNKRNAFDGDNIIADKIEVINKGRNILMSDVNGKIYLLNAKFEIRQKLENHNQPLLLIHYDKANQLIVTACRRCIKIHKLNQGKNNDKPFYKVIRKISNCIKGKREMKVVKVSTALNLVLMTVGDNYVYVVDYEFGRLHCCLELSEEHRIRDITFITTKGIILITTAIGKLIVIEYEFEVFTPGLKCEFKYLDEISVKTDSIDSTDFECFECVVDETIFNFSKEPSDILVMCSFKDGSVVLLKAGEGLRKIKEKSKYYNKISFNNKRTNKTCFKSDIINIKTIKLLPYNETSENKLFHLTGITHKNLFSVDHEFELQLKNFKKTTFFQQNVFYVSSWNKSIFKIFNKNGICIVKYHLNKPYKNLWDFSFCSSHKARQKIDNALFLIDQINNRISSKKSILKETMNTKNLKRIYESLHVESPAMKKRKTKKVEKLSIMPKLSVRPFNKKNSGSSPNKEKKYSSFKRNQPQKNRKQSSNKKRA